MADRGDTHYKVPALNKWFLFASVLLLVTAVWMVIDDYLRPWKDVQRDFREIELERAEAELSTDKAQKEEAEEQRLLAELADAQAQVDTRAADIKAVKEKIFQLKGDVFEKTEAAKSVKQSFNWERYLVEEHRLQGEENYGEEKLEKLKLRMAETAGDQQEAELALKQEQDLLKSMLSDVTEAEKRAKQAAKDIDLVRKKKESLAPDKVSEKIAMVIKDDIPGLDFIAPDIKVNKVVLDDLTFDLNFTKKTRIDMCKTCHMAEDRDGFEGDLEQPHRSHPRLDLYLTAKSPHPYNKVGCTICHRGAGEALDFVRVDHNVSRVFEEEKAERWHEEYGWHKKHYWDYPMLTSDKIEASCVQCHKDSMELIAQDAPEVTKGYRLFERYACYACHKVDWFPTKRKPGPSLKNILAKTNPDWMESWIANPRAFRPTTWMPQIFHLENWAPEAVVAESNYGTGRDILGGEWNDSAVAAVAAFIRDRAPRKAYPAVPVEGDSQRGRELYRLNGCLACHNMAPYAGEEPATHDLAFDAARYNQVGPNLRGVATKLEPEWLFAWLKNPKAVWSETRMPDLRLEDQDAADITAYIMEDPDGVFHDVPDGWKPAPSPYAMDVLAEQARWYFSRLPRAELADRLAGKDPENRWDRPDDLLVAVGEKLVQQYGCFSCHEIQGYEKANPIGTELTTWGSKTVDKLDWALIPDQKQEEFGWTQHRREEFKSYRENWIRQKLHEPRSYDRGKVKTPTERLKMPWFDFDDDQVEALMTFVVGLVKDEVQHAKMVPSPAQTQMETGLRAIRQENCVGCHVIEPGTVTYRDEGGEVRTVKAELMSLDEFKDAGVHPIPPQTSMDDLNAFLATYGEKVGEDVEELGFRLLGTNPDVGRPADTVFVERGDLIDVTPSWGGDFVRLATNYYYYGVEHHDPESDEFTFRWGTDEWAMVEDADGEHRDYSNEFYTKVRWTFAPPVLWNEGAKLQKDWFYSFLNEPYPLREQMRVRMPTFNFPDGYAGAIADYFAQKAVLDWPGEFARRFRADRALSLDEMAQWTDDAAAKTKGLSALSADTLAEIEADSQPTIHARLKDLMNQAGQVGFTIPPPPDPDHQRVRRRAPSYLETAHIAVGAELARTGPKCFTCHFDSGTAPEAVPLSWAPDLAHARARLREDWVVEWLQNPNLIYPGTSMPGNFLSEPAQYQEIYPDSTNQQQIDAITDWLFNYDRVPKN